MCRTEATMKKDAKTFHEVAERCTKFCPCDKCGFSNETNYSATSKTTGGASDCGSSKTGSNKSSNKTGSNKSTNNTNSSNRATNATSENVSCKNCSHYDPSKVCTLDLYTEIVENHHL